MDPYSNISIDRSKKRNLTIHLLFISTIRLASHADVLTLTYDEPSLLFGRMNTFITKVLPSRENPYIEFALHYRLSITEVISDCQVANSPSDLLHQGCSSSESAQ